MHWFKIYPCLKFLKKHRFWSMPCLQSQFASAAKGIPKWVFWQYIGNTTLWAVNQSSTQHLAGTSASPLLIAVAVFFLPPEESWNSVDCNIQLGVVCECVWGWGWLSGCSPLQVVSTPNLHHTPALSCIITPPHHTKISFAYVGQAPSIVSIDCKV